MAGLEAIWYSTKQPGHHQDLRELFLNWFSLDFFARIRIDRDNDKSSLINIKNKFADSKRAVEVMIKHCDKFPRRKPADCHLYTAWKTEMYEVVAPQALASICSEHHYYGSWELSVNRIGKFYASGNYKERDWPEAENPDEKRWVAGQIKQFEHFRLASRLPRFVTEPPTPNMMTEDHNTNTNTGPIKTAGLEAIWYSTKQPGHHQDLRELFLNWFSLDFFTRIRIDKDNDISNLINIEKRFADSKKAVEVMIKHCDKFPRRKPADCHLYTAWKNEMCEVVAPQALASICSEHPHLKSWKLSVNRLGKFFLSGNYKERDWPEAENPDEKRWVAGQIKQFENRGTRGNGGNSRRRA
jgi:hypothetical protein